MSISLTMSAKCNAATEADSRTQKTERIQPAWQGERAFHPWPLATAPAHPPTDPLPQASAAYTEAESTSRCSTLLDEVDGDGRMSSCSSPLDTNLPQLLAQSLFDSPLNLQLQRDKSWTGS